MKLFIALILVIFTLTSFKNAKTQRTGVYGCGSRGQCWTWCDSGAGWCYTEQRCSKTTDCDANLECKLPRVCSHNW